MNKVLLIGNLTRDPETATTQSGIACCKFTIGVTRRFSKDKEADFINIVTWRGLADNCGKYLEKGKKVAVTGSLQIGSYENKEGQKRYTADVVADEVEFLSFGNAAEAPQKQADITSLEEFKGQPINEDLPF